MVRINTNISLDQLIYLEDMTRDYIATYPDDVETWLTRYTYMVEIRSANEIAGRTKRLNTGANGLQRFDAWYEALKEAWPPNDWGLEDEEYYGGTE